MSKVFLSVRRTPKDSTIEYAQSTQKWLEKVDNLQGCSLRRRISSDLNMLYVGCFSIMLRLLENKIILNDEHLSNTINDTHTAMN